MNDLKFSFSDTIAGYVTTYDKGKDAFGLKTADGREFQIELTPTTYAELVRNLGEAWHDATGPMREMLVPGRFLYAYGIFYPEKSGARFEVKHLIFLGRKENEYRFEEQDWWIKQIRGLADFYLSAQFPDGNIDFARYQTQLNLEGVKGARKRQEADTISRLVYGLASAYMLTGDDRYLEAATKGTEYLHKHFRFSDQSAGVCYWYHAVDIKPDGSMQKILASEFGDDYDAIPCYEQIYALAGPTQTYRVTGNPAILNDINDTIALFQRFFKDKSERGGYYSHIDPITFSPHSASLDNNRAKKNWNSVGDHAPAYLINLCLATNAPEHIAFLEETFDTIARRFPDFKTSPFVFEKFNDDWTPDMTTVQKNRAIIGHNLKIAWNLMRMHSLKPKDEYFALAKRIAALMPEVGMDKQRGGWYDMAERELKPGQDFHRLVWHDRKAWWQQEQGILAYLILCGVTGEPQYLKTARESASFNSAFVLDTDSGGAYFNVLANGLPYLVGSERSKGSHSMSMYHQGELAYLASVYTNLLITKEPMDFYFSPMAGGFPDNVLRVQPDYLPPGSVRIDEVWIDGKKYTDFDAKGLSVKLPADHGQIKIRVRLVPTSVAFSASELEAKDGTMRIALGGTLDHAGLKYLEEALERAKAQKLNKLIFLADDLQAISSEAIRYLAFTKQRLGASFTITFLGAPRNVVAAIEQSGFSEEIRLVGRTD
jgi:mannose/cellobiose epimerase-like protein (N-acyl-D-glucosamine 2-epimerase family)